MKLLIAEFRQESNSLSPFVSDQSFWEHNGWILDPAGVRSAHQGTGSAVDGMLSEIEGAHPDADVVFGPAFYAQSGGTASQAVMDLFCDRLDEVLAAHGDVDAILLSCHGALQTTDFDDAEAEVLRRIRERVGDRCVIAVSTDLHGYISRELVERADVVCGYQTYPHVDFEETGRRTARLALRMLDPESPGLALAWAPVPMIVSASAYNTLEGEFAELVEHGRGLVRDGHVLDFTVYQMQPWLDVLEPHSTVVVIALDEDTALSRARELADMLYRARHSFEPALATIDEAIDIALDPASAKPVILVDSADSNNAGAPGDSMAVPQHVLKRATMPRSASVVADPAAVARAFAAGVGAVLEFWIGGAVDETAPRIRAEGYVRSLHDGVFRPESVGHTGDLVRVGRTAVLRFRDLDVVVCEVIAGNGDPQLYRAFGVEPTMYDLVVVKANTSFRAGYRGIAGTIVPTDTPGSASANVRMLPFRRMPRTIYPWVDDPFEAIAERPR